MSAISGNSSLSALFTNLASYTQSQTTSTLGSALSGTATTSIAGATPSTSSTGGRHHHRTGGADGPQDAHQSSFFQQLQQTVTNALQQAQQNGTTQNPNSVITTALEKFFKQEGSQNSKSPNGQTAGAADSDGDADGSTAQSSTAFASQLESYGVDSGQFFQDFQTAVQNAQNGTVDPSTAFQNLPTGLSVDVNA